MAVRSGAGTGVVVSLVVFVIITICLLVLSIVFYTGQTDAREAQAEAEAALSTYVKPAQRNNDMFKRIEAASGSQSVAMHLLNQYEELMAFVDGNPKTDLAGLQARAERFGVEQGETIMGAMQSMDRNMNSVRSQLETNRNLLGDKDQQLDEMNARIESLKRNQQQEVESLQNQISAYAAEADRYRQEVQDTIARVNDSKESMRADYEQRIDELEDEKDELNQELYLLRNRVDQLQQVVRKSRQRAENPAMLVDGRVIDTLSRDEVFINRGRKHRIQLGMTFEVYSSAEAIRPNEAGELPRGKASLQVMQVGEQTSKCKITRSAPGQPVVSDDVIANAVYDPTYQFKFLVHGKFDVDNDGRPSENEAEYLRSRIIDWGGTVVTGEELPGDLDFLVLGMEPPTPGILPPDASQERIARWIEQKRASETYDRLFRQAREAQIPVLNSNRFFILIGSTSR